MITPRNPLGRSSSPDDDPTGVRALLSSLPDPGPMPPELVERITASLAEEQRARSEQAGEPGANGERTAYGSAGSAAATGGASVSPLVRRRRRRQLLSGIAGAAAAVVVGWVGVSALQPSGSSSGSLAGGSVDSARSSSSLNGAERPGGGSTAGGGSAGRPHAQGLEAGKLSAVQVQRSGRDYRAATFATQAAALAADATTSAPRGHAAPQAGGGSARITTPAGLTDCLAGLGVQPTAAHPAVADLARYAGTPAVVLVVTSRGHDRAWAVGRDCSASDPHVLHGPVTVR